MCVTPATLNPLFAFGGSDFVIYFFLLFLLLLSLLLLVVVVATFLFLLLLLLCSSYLFVCRRVLFIVILYYYYCTKKYSLLDILDMQDDLPAHKAIKVGAWPLEHCYHALVVDIDRHSYWLHYQPPLSLALSSTTATKLTRST
jgi:hypothetical protein